ncbi:MAG TPA: ABC transporter permease subunit [Aggregatilinea sp.]|uniref:ABC transporter permease n=1 Tax=Aggregatilinea sp. TaxID=2806333 RepID=UPI002CF2AAB5|nr:ABC transporter permease subunit [Aggregatilinea sp.]HML21768.1 ABC transporter permease subunit [Aggregatilinea sp.]
MRVFRVQLRKELLELWRTRKVLIVVVVLVAFGLMSPLFAKLTPELLKSMGDQQNIQIIITEPTTKDATDQFVKNTTQFGLLLGVLMSFGTIVGERERGQATLIFPHPLPRETFVLAKFAALAILFGLGLLLGALADFLYTVLLFEAPPIGGFVALVAFIYLWLLCLIALSLLASALGRSMTSAGGLAFAFLLVVLVASSLTRYAPGKITDWGHTLAVGANGPAQWGALIITLALTALAVGGSAYALRKQEID